MIDFFMLLKTIPILFILYLHIIQKIQLPLWVLILLIIGSFGITIVHGMRFNMNYVMHNGYNLLIVVFGMIALSKSMRK